MRVPIVQEEIDFLKDEGILPRTEFTTVAEMHRKKLNETIKKHSKTEKRFFEVLTNSHKGGLTGK